MKCIILSLAFVVTGLIITQRSYSQDCIELVHGTKKIYASGDQKVFCTVNENGTVSIKAEKLAMAKGKNGKVVSYLSFNMKKDLNYT